MRRPGLGLVLVCALTMVVMQPAQEQTATPQHIEAVTDRSSEMRYYGYKFRA